MKLEIYKETDRNLKDVFEKVREVKEVKLQIGDITLFISEHQLGFTLDKPHISIMTDKIVYSMDFNDFINNSIN